MIEIDDEGRTKMKALREGVSLSRYLDDVWHRRDEAQGRPKKLRRKAWPWFDTYKKQAREAAAAQQPPRGGNINVANLPTRLRAEQGARS